MTPTSQKQFVPGTRFEVDHDMGRLWIALRDQRRHSRSEVLNQLQSEDPEDRLKWFKHHGPLPKAGDDYRYTVHDDGEWLCLEAHKIEEISN